MLRFLPLGAATHLSYEINFVGGEYSLEDEALYWHQREERGEVVEVHYAPRPTIPHPRKLDPIYTQHREIGYELTYCERQQQHPDFSVARARIRALQAARDQGRHPDDAAHPVIWRFADTSRRRS